MTTEQLRAQNKFQRIVIDELRTKIQRLEEVNTVKRAQRLHVARTQAKQLRRLSCSV